MRWEVDCGGSRTKVSDHGADLGWLVYGVGVDGEGQSNHGGGFGGAEVVGLAS